MTMDDRPERRAARRWRTSRSWRFGGQIAGVGTASGTRVIVGRWTSSPLGAFADVMVEHADGRRVLLAPNERIAEFVTATYSFDDVVRTPVRVVTTPHRWALDAGPLRLRFGIGSRPPEGVAVHLAPRRLATAPWWTVATDPVARVLVPGVRTHGSAGNMRHEFYGACDVRRISWVDGSWDGAGLGALTAVRPPVRFGFGSTPARPCLTWLVTTIRVPPDRQL